MRTFRSMVAECLASAAVCLAGCDRAEETAKTVAPRTTDLGTGINAVERTYACPVATLVDVTRKILKSLGLTVKTEVHDALGGELSALRADGHTVHARMTAVDPDHSKVSLWVAPGNRDLADLIQARIAEATRGELHP